MKKILILTFVIAMGVASQTITSPSKTVRLTFSLSSDSIPMYQLERNGRAVIAQSQLGLSLADGPSFDRGFAIVSAESSLVDETWKPVLGELKEIRNSYRQLKVTLSQPHVSDRKLIILFRVYDDGIGFRYEFPAQRSLGHFVVSDELSRFQLTGDHKAFWIPGDFDTNEYSYYESRLSEVDALQGLKVGEIFSKSVLGKNFVQSPLMMKSDNGLYINIFEATLVNYPAMALEIDQSTFSLKSTLASDPVGNKAYLQTPAKTPWRTVIVSEKAADILSSKMILNLNEPTAYTDVSWIKPMKYVGIWWEMHVGTASWNYSDTNNVSLKATSWNALRPNGRHGATTQRTKYYIDFAATHGFDGVLVEGWNVGWEDWFGRWKEEVFDFVTPYPDFDVEELQKYAESKGVQLIMHHETSASVTNYERRMDEAFRFMKKHGYHAVKTGYVGRIIPRGELHDGQWMVNHYLRTVEKAASYHIMVNSHESARLTGLHRTYPNWIAAEAARGNEFNAWSIGNPPAHETILPFTRFMGGPMDYTPGIFEIKMNYYAPEKKEQVHTTLAKQLALYVTIYSPLQMAADFPENYEKHLDAFQFIKDVAVDWDDSRVLEAEPGDYVTIVRKAKGTDRWFLGAITDEHSRTTKISLGFLDKGKKYVAAVYADGKDADWEKNPKSYRITRSVVTAEQSLRLILAPGGGAAVSFLPASKDDLKKYPLHKD